SPGHTVWIERDHARLPGRCDAVVLRQCEIQIALLLVALPDQVERASIRRHQVTGPRQDQFKETVLIALRRQGNANFVHRCQGCGAVERMLRELRALAAPGIRSPQRLPKGLWISHSDVRKWDPGPCRWYLWTRPHAGPA